MINNLIRLIIIICITFSFKFTLAEVQFNFDVTEVQVSEKGNKFVGLKRGTVTTTNGITLDADKFEYDKRSNILVATGNVIIKDLNNDITITSNDITYFKNDELIFTKSRSKVVNENTTIDANSLKYNKKLNTLNAKGDVTVKDKIKNFIILSNDITYYKNKEKFISKSESEAFGG